MSLASGDQRFFASTRGRIVALLRRASRTVDELAQALGLTDNAVRAQLTALTRDGLVRPAGLRRGASKPAVAYELTAAADRLFPQVYDATLRLLLDVLAERLAPEQTEKALREVGRRLAEDAVDGAGLRGMDGTLRARVERGAKVLGKLGSMAEVEEGEASLVITGYHCPLAAALPGHPEICRLTETLLATVMQAPVQEHCERGDPPRCRFEVRMEDAVTSV